MGTYPVNAEICGTTHKTVKQAIGRIEAGQQRPVRALRPSNYEGVRTLVADAVKAGRCGSAPSGCCPRRRRWVRRFGPELPAAGRAGSTLPACSMMVVYVGPGVGASIGGDRCHRGGCRVVAKVRRAPGTRAKVAHSREKRACCFQRTGCLTRVSERRHSREPAAPALGNSVRSRRRCQGRRSRLGATCSPLGC